MCFMFNFIRNKYACSNTFKSSCFLKQKTIKNFAGKLPQLKCLESTWRDLFTGDCQTCTLFTILFKIVLFSHTGVFADLNVHCYIK